MTLVAGIFMAILIFPGMLPADVTFIWWGAPAEARIRVGAVSGETTVVHTVPVANIGDGTPIAGSPQYVVIEVSARRASVWDAWGTNFVVTADSSTPLSNGAEPIYFNEIRWTSELGDIPDGRFDGSSAQVILPPTGAFWQVSDRLTFIYDNNRVVSAGTYSGSVTYTVSIP